MLDQGGNAGIAEHRRAESPSAKRSPGSARRSRSDAAASSSRRSRPERSRPCAARAPRSPARPAARSSNTLELHAGEQDLRIDEAGAEIEQRARPALRAICRVSGEGRRPALKARHRRGAGCASPATAPTTAASRSDAAPTERPSRLRASSGGDACEARLGKSCARLRASIDACSRAQRAPRATAGSSPIAAADQFLEPRLARRRSRAAAAAFGRSRAASWPIGLPSSSASQSTSRRSSAT